DGILFLDAAGIGLPEIQIDIIKLLTSAGVDLSKPIKFAGSESDDTNVINNYNKDLNELALPEGTTAVDIIKQCLGSIEIGNDGIGIGLAKNVLDTILALVGFPFDMPDVNFTVQANLFKEGLITLNLHLGLLSNVGKELAYVKLSLGGLSATLAPDQNFLKSSIDKAFAKVDANGDYALDDKGNYVAKKYNEFPAISGLDDLNTLKNIYAGIKLNLNLQNESVTANALGMSLSNFLNKSFGITTNVNVPDYTVAGIAIDLQLKLPSSLLSEFKNIKNLNIKSLLGKILDEGEIKLDLDGNYGNGQSSKLLGLYYGGVDKALYIKSDLLGIKGLKIVDVAKMISGLIPAGTGLQKEGETLAEADSATPIDPTSTSALFANGDLIGAIESVIGNPNQENTYAAAEMFLKFAVKDDHITAIVSAQVINVILNAVGVKVPFALDKIIHSIGVSLGTTNGSFDLGVVADISDGNGNKIAGINLSIGDIRLQVNKDFIVTEDETKYSTISVNPIIDNSRQNNLKIGATADFSLSGKQGQIYLSQLLNSISKVVAVPPEVATILNDMIAYINLTEKENAMAGKYSLNIDGAVNLNDILSAITSKTVNLSFLQLQIQILQNDKLMLALMYDSTAKKMYIDLAGLGGNKIYIDNVDLLALLNKAFAGGTTPKTSELNLAGTAPKLDQASIINMINSVLKEVILSPSDGTLGIVSSVINTAKLQTIFTMFGLQILLPELPEIRDIGFELNLKKLGIGLSATIGNDSSVAGYDPAEVTVKLGVGNLRIDGGTLFNDNSFIDYKAWDTLQLNANFAMEMSLGMGKSVLADGSKGNLINLAGLIKSLLGSKAFDENIITVEENLAMNIYAEVALAIDLNGFAHDTSKNINIELMLNLYLNLSGGGKGKKIISLYYDGFNGADVAYVDLAVLDHTGVGLETTKIAVENLMQMALGKTIADMLRGALGAGNLPVDALNAQQLNTAEQINTATTSGKIESLSIVAGVNVLS
ncbi:MAG: hypothetical protein RR454_04900, partial [Clostridia bacterium]